MRARGTETQNLCGIPESQAYRKAIWLRRFSDNQVGRQECHGPVGGHGTFIKKTSTMKPKSVFPTGWGVELGCVRVCVCVCVHLHVYEPKLF